jgi:transcriptional regulator with XRE-family HTH domain
MEVNLMPDQLGDVLNHARRARRLTLRRLAERVCKEDGQPVSPQYLNDIELNRRIPSTHLLYELARELELEADTLLRLAGLGETVMREYLDAHPAQAEEVIQLFRTAQQHGFQDWARLRKIMERGHPKKGRDA